MAVKGAKTIAEYMIRKWMEQQDLDPARFEMVMTGNREAVIRDSNGDELCLEYDQACRMVILIND